jgi:asparagine synthetase B (glutamine-hydrolysing)
VKLGIQGALKPAPMLSGGLDSSSVVCTAATLLQKENKDLNSYTHIPYFVDKYKTPQHIDLEMSQNW